MQGNKKLSDAKLAKDFQAVLVEFQNAQKIAQEREKMFAPFVPEDVLQTRSGLSSIFFLKLAQVLLL